MRTWWRVSAFLPFARWCGIGYILLLSCCCLQLILSSGVTARQRAVLHELSEVHGLQHRSVGEGLDRRLVIGPDEATHVTAAPQGDGKISDAQLADLIQQHLHIDARPSLATAAPPPSNTSGKLSAAGAAGQDGGAVPEARGMEPGQRSFAGPQAKGMLTVEEFVAKVGGARAAT